MKKRLKENKRRPKKAEDYTDGATWTQTVITSDFSRWEMRWHLRNLLSINQSINQSINRFLGGIKKKWLSFNHLILLKLYLPTFDFIIFNIWSKNWSTLGDKNRWKEGRTEKVFSQMSFLHFYRIVITKPYLKLELNVFPQKREKKRKF